MVCYVMICCGRAFFFLGGSPFSICIDLVLNATMDFNVYISVVVGHNEVRPVFVSQVSNFVKEK